ncbi:putative ABC transporter periplasmic binding protein [Actinobacillus equuli]|nr:putative ABC transporter periplasmic binding protein [Actinobacillus equuli]
MALAHDNALVWAWAKENPTFDVAIGSVGPTEQIAPAVQKGNQALLDAINKEIAELKANGKLKAAYEKTLVPVYGDKPELLAQ